MYKLLDKYIIINFLGKILITLLTFITIFVLVDIIDNLDHIMDSKMSSIEIIKYYLHSIPWYLSIALPMSLLLGTVFTMGILQKNNELSAIKASGISIGRLAIPLFIIGILFSIFSFYFENLIVTHHLQQRNEIGIKYNLISSKSNKMKKKNIYRQESPNKILGIKNYKFRSQVAENISIQNIENGKLQSRLDAPYMKWDSKTNQWIIPEYYIRNWKNETLNYLASNNDSILQLEFTPTDLIQTTVKPEEMNYWELVNFVDKLKKNGVKDPRWAVNMHFKTAFACTSILMVIFGLSLSIRNPRSSLTVGIGISIFVIFIYYAGIKTGQSLGFKGALSPFISVWAPNFIFLLSGLYLFKNTKS